MTVFNDFPNPDVSTDKGSEMITFGMDKSWQILSKSGRENAETFISYDL